MVVFLGVAFACYGAVVGIEKLWKKHREAVLKGRFGDGMVFAAKAAQLLLLLVAALHLSAGQVGWQAVGAAAFVAMTPLIFALAVLAQLHSDRERPRGRAVLPKPR